MDTADQGELEKKSALTGRRARWMKGVWTPPSHGNLRPVRIELETLLQKLDETRNARWTENHQPALREKDNTLQVSSDGHHALVPNMEGDGRWPQPRHGHSGRLC